MVDIGGDAEVARVGIVHHSRANLELSAKVCGSLVAHVEGAGDDDLSSQEEPGGAREFVQEQREDPPVDHPRPAAEMRGGLVAADDVIPLAPKAELHAHRVGGRAAEAAGVRGEVEVDALGGWGEHGRILAHWAGIVQDGEVRALVIAAVATGFFTVAGCGRLGFAIVDDTDGARADLGSSIDSSVDADGGTLDSSVDQGPVLDSGPTPDQGAADGGVIADGGVVDQGPPDAGVMPPDGGPIGDTVITTLTGSGTPAEQQLVRAATGAALARTTSTTFQDVRNAVLSLPAASSDWIVIITARIASSVTGPNVSLARVVVDGVPREVMSEAIDAADGHAPVHYVEGLSGAAPHTVQVQHRSATGDTASISTVNLVAFTLPAGADGRMASRLNAPVSMSSFTPVVGDTLAAGDYLVIAQWVHGLGSTSEARFVTPSATLPIVDTTGAHLRNPSTACRSQLLAHRVSLPFAGEVRIEGRGGAFPAARIVSFRTNAFTHFESATMSGVVTGSMSPAVATSVTTSAGDATRQVVLYGVAMGGAGSLDAKIAEYTVNSGATDLYRHISLSDTLVGSFAVVRSNTAAANTYGVTFAGETTATSLFAKDGTVHAIGF